ncbi:MAG: 30S ribosomal protein S8 [Candidatus Marinimicrobia bacterium]|nr:30S ribosomal protein S8 [Candidatus Neomarinimicrobiota bacterium]MCF7827486.1 30S ribosomal protein S8 [Candidatus Neomarinimicrobiota bacterium]MCF7882384.1 30S ribosomal protein S8 [Candidatus Neomarinimicrobiota bacterium]
MSQSDPIADYLTQIRNGIMAKKRWVDIPASNLKKRMSLLLKREHFIKDFYVIEDNKQDVIRIFLKYTREGEGVIEGLKRVSRPGRRRYVGVGEIPKVLNGLGTAVMTTSKGIMTDKQARAMGVGGEVLYYIW